MSYFNVMAPHFLSHHIYDKHQIAALSATYYYGDSVKIFIWHGLRDFFAVSLAEPLQLLVSAVYACVRKKINPMFFDIVLSQ